jgi:hypothetical protein
MLYAAHGGEKFFRRSRSRNIAQQFSGFSISFKGFVAVSQVIRRLPPP